MGGLVGVSRFFVFIYGHGAKGGDSIETDKLVPDFQVWRPTAAATPPASPSSLSWPARIQSKAD